MASYRVEIPHGVRVPGVTADGCATAVLPGEYLVHQLPRKLPLAPPLFRFVGADASGRDVHVPLGAFQCFLDADPLRSLALAESA
ncbi:MAG: hypothetical protein ACJ8IK_07640 [Burkholderiaceae bacterium]|jgi:hypothetical protein